MNHADPAEPSGTCHADEALADFMQRLDRGEPMDRERFLADHPELADELRAYFAACDAVAEVAGGGLPPTARLVYPTQPAAEWSPAPARSFGDYEVIEELARGGMGVIYKARQYVGTTLPRPYRLVALKMIRGGPAAAPLEVRRFQREAEAVARLDHPHIVPVYEVGEHDGQHYFSMKLVEGGSLAQHLADYRLPIRNAKTGRDSEGVAWTPAEIAARKGRSVALMANVAHAVHYAHQHGVLHRDLKPANILLDASGEPHVTDFGLAKRLPLAEGSTADGPLTQSGLIVGTPNYMAPEQARGGAPPSTAADVHSLGAILYELLTGRPPFREATPLATLMKLLDAEPTPPRALNALVEADLETICLKCLRKEPGNRYGSARELAEELERWRAGEPIRARPVGKVERCLKWARRRPALAALAGACLTVAVLGLGGTVWQWAKAQVAYEQADRDLETSRQSLYLRNIALARHERLLHVGRAIDYLEKCELHRRRWEWHYLDRLCHGELRTLQSHVGTVIGVVYSPDGRHVISTGDDRTVRIWDARTGQLLQTFTGHTDGVLGVTCSPDGRQIATAGADSLIKLWDAATGAEQHTLRNHGKAVTSLAYAHDGRRLVSGSEDGTVRLWDPTMGRELAILTRHEGVVSGVAFSPDGQRVASSSWDRRVKLWDLPSGQEIFTTPRYQWQWTGVAFSPGGERLAATSDEGRVLVWHSGKQQVLFRMRGPTQRLQSPVFSPDEQRFACAAEDGTIQVWDLTGEEERLDTVLRGHTRQVNGVAFSPDGQRLATTSLDGTVRLWDAVRNRDELLIREQTGSVLALAFSASGEWLASAGRDGAVRLADPQTGQFLRDVPSRAQEACCLAVMPGDDRLISGDASGVVGVWDTKSGQRLSSWRAHEQAVRGLALHAAGREVFTAGADGVIRLWDAASGQMSRELPQKYGPLTAAAFSSDGRFLAAARRDRDYRIDLWEVQTGAALRSFQGHQAAVTGLAFDNLDRLASVSYDKTTRLWNMETGQEMLVLARHRQPPLAVAFSANGHLLATGGLDKTVRVYDGTPR